MKQNIIVMFGGVSCEHDISIITAVQVLNSLDAYLYNIIPVYFTKQGKILTSNKYFDITNFKCNIKAKSVQFNAGNGTITIGCGITKKLVKVDTAIVCIHGKNGEDGMACALCTYANIPYTCPSLVGSVVGIDKVIFKDVLKSINVNCLPAISVTTADYKLNKSKVFDDISNFGYPVIIKPAMLGSSIGVVVCKNAKNIDKNINFALKFDKKLLIEQYIDKFDEVNVAIYKKNNKLVVSRFEQPIKNSDILTFENKYIGSSKIVAKRITPKLSKEIKKYIVSSAKRVYNYLDLSGVVRFDYIVADKAYLNEINTVPGSMANYLFNISFDKLLNNLILQAKIDFEERKNCVNYFKSSVLDGTPLGKGGKL